MGNEQSHTAHSTADDLLTRCRQGDRSAFNQLIQTYQDQVFTYLFHLTGDQGAAQKMTGQTFVTAYKRLKRYSNTITIKGWLLSLAEQQIHKRKRRSFAWLSSFFSTRKARLGQDEERQENVEAKDHTAPDCATISPMLSAFLDGELAELDAKRVERHLQHCDHCQQAYDDLVDTLNILQTFGQHQAPPDLRVSVNAAIDAAAPSLRDSLSAWLGVPGARVVTVMAMLLVAVFSTLLYTQHQQIRQLQQKFVLDTRRGEPVIGNQPAKTTFVILTGASTVKDMLLEHAGWLSEHITVPPEETELLFIQGTEADLSRMLEQRIQAVNGTITHEERLQEQSFHVRTLTIEVPKNMSEFFLSVLRPLDVESTTPEYAVNTSTFTIMIIEKL